MSTATAASIDSPIISFITPIQTEKWELGVALILNNWRALSDAVAAEWGGADSSDKRDWLCGAICEMFVDRPETDAGDIEETLVGVMEDEFEVILEDDSAYEMGKKIMLLREKIAQGDWKEVDEMHQKFLAKPKNQVPPKVEEVVGEAGSSEDEDEDNDIEMGDTPAPPQPPPRERTQPAVDEDGFELVQGKGRRR